MIIIENIKAIIKTRDSKNYGFDFRFNKGLNILTGYNASGKSTVLSCIYYCLGMEQLLGGYNADGLDDCLKKEFKYDKKSDIKVNESYAEIIIKNEKDEQATIRRQIKSLYDEELNQLSVTFKDTTTDKYIHSKGDSDSETGFYRWLAEFIGIKLPQYDSSKILYLQHIFACALVEQTKGWSDFFAQTPNFNTKKPKQKIVEYSLGMNCLIDEFKSDILKKELQDVKQSWNNTVVNFKSLSDSFNVELPSLSDDLNSSVSPFKINKLQLWLKDVRGNLISLDEKISKLNIEYNASVSSNIISTNGLDKIKLEEYEKAKEQIKLLNTQLDKVSLEYHNEQEKRVSYSSIIKSRENEIETLESLSKIGKLKNISISDVSNCPVCDSKLLKDNETILKNQEKVGTLNSIEFYKSEVKLYKSYLSNSDKLIARFEKIKLFYTEQINNKKIAFQAISSELYDDSRMPSREKIATEILLKTELNKHELILRYFNEFKKELLPKCEKLGQIREDLKTIDNRTDDDELILNKFTTHFKKMLGEFHYSDELLKKVIFDNEEPQKLLPAISGREKPQPIRLKSSASDFIRSLWAFYLSLLTESKQHVGFLVLDEPGQHAMDKKSMIELLKYSSTLKNRQVILAISRNHSISDKTEINLKDIIGDLKENVDFYLNTIEDNGRTDKCVQITS